MTVYVFRFHFYENQYHSARIMTQEKTTCSIAILALFDLLKDKGFSASDIADKIGISVSLIGEPEVKIPISQMLILWDTAIAATGDPALGLHLRGKYGRHFMHFVVTIAKNSASLLESAQQWVQYAKLICEVDQISIQETENSFFLTYSNLCPIQQCISMIEHDMSKAVIYAREFSQQNFKPIEVCFTYPKPPYFQEYEKIFQCPIRFDQAENRIIMDKKDMHRKIVGRDPHLCAVLKKHADTMITAYEDKDLFSQKVETYIAKNLSLGKLTLESAANSLMISRSTLHRKLKQENTSFSDILENTRKALAQSYFRNGMNTVQTTFLLGFSDPSTFQHAFRRWYGTSPGEYRKNIRMNG